MNKRQRILSKIKIGHVLSRAFIDRNDLSPLMSLDELRAHHIQVALKQYRDGKSDGIATIDLAACMYTYMHTHGICSIYSDFVTIMDSRKLKFSTDGCDEHLRMYYDIQALLKREATL